MGEQVELEDWIAEKIAKMARRKKTKIADPDCVACGNTRVSSKGKPCVCVTVNGARQKVTKKVIAKKVSAKTKAEAQREADELALLRDQIAREEGAERVKKRRRKKVAKKVVTKPIPEPEVVKRRPARKAKSLFATTFVKREARSMFTTEIKNAQLGSRVKGAIVRVKAAEGDSTADLDAFGSFLVENGATTFKTLSAPAKPALLGAPTPTPDISAVASPREAVEAILNEENDDALTEATEESMSEVGL